MARKQRNKQDHERSAPPRAHIPVRQNVRPHIAQEARDMGDIDTAENLTRGLLPKFRGRVQGLKDTHYVFPGFRSSYRRDILAQEMKDVK
jgi:hypothetical protein